VDVFVEQLASLCREHVTRHKWVFVPTHAIGRTLGERIALSGTNWLNLRFVTPLDIALRMGAPFLVERGIEPSEEGLGAALIMRLLLDLPQEGGYFRPLADQPTLAQALWSTIRELRTAGVKSDDLRADAFASLEKYAELRALLASYEHFLTSNKRGDMALVYEEALEHRDWCPIHHKDCWIEQPDVVWTPQQRQLMAAMPGERIAPRAVELPGASLPRRLSSANATRVPPDPARSPLAFLLAPKADRGQRNASGSERVALFHAGGREAEIEEVFRRVLAAGAPLDQMEIACASSAHVSLIWEKALRHGWPVTLGPGTAATSTRPGRALLGFCDWIETDFSAGHLRHLLQSGDMGIEEEDEGFRAGQAARTLARAEAGWGRATYGLSLGLLAKSYHTRANDPELSDDERSSAKAKAALTEKIAIWITKLIAAVPEPAPNGKVPLLAVVDVSLAFLERSSARASQLDHRAAAALGDHVMELRALGAFECSLREALHFIRERVESLNVAPERPRPGHLHVCNLQQAAYAGRPYLFVVGLEEGRVFPNAAEDPVLLDPERAATSPHLRLSSDRIDESVHAVLSRLATWGDEPKNEAGREPANREPSTQEAKVTVSYSCRDTREFRETYASWLMLQAFRLQQGDASLSYHQMKAALGEPVSSLPLERGAAATSASWWLRSVVGTAGRGVAAVEESFGALARGRAAEAHRESDRFTEFDGHVPEAGKVLDPCAPANAFSVTELEAAAACPYRFFLKRGLGLRPVDDGVRDKDIWLDPLTRGSELHDIYAALLRRCRAADRRPDLEKDGEWLTSLAKAALDRLNLEMPPATEEILERESRDFLADVELFLEVECGATGSEPVGLEVSFGRTLRDDDEELARAEPVEIDLGSGLKFRIAGRIDRIDKVGPAEFQVLDYKTGGYWRDDWTGTFNGGRRLQHALYGLAAVALLRERYPRARVTGATYYFCSHKGRSERLVIAAPSLSQTAAVLGELRKLIVKGSFIHAADVKACKWCDYEAACGDGVHEQAQGKLGDAKLKAFGRLAAHV
jgi:ATP-dependent helicase/nuclease subunit B